MEQEEVNSLIEKYIHGIATADERQRLLHWYRTHHDEPPQWIIADLEEEEQLKTRLFQQISMMTEPTPAPAPKTPVLWRRQWFQVAASITLLLGVSLWVVNRDSADPQLATRKPVRSAILPGKQTAMLTLSDGSVVNLDGSGTGQIAKQSGVSISKTEQGELVYEIKSPKGNSPEAKASYNTISTPRGGRYQINLPDGTRVWLNAASSLRFPTVFGTTARRVELSGEGYFEVAKNPNAPFKVLSRSATGLAQEIEVLGTHFNANTYGDEGHSLKTTLMEGKVVVSTPGKKGGVTLKPGQQSVVVASAIQIAQVDLEEVMAWKNGYFIFNNEDLKSVMSKLSRWYDVEIVYAEGLSDINIGGSISQQRNLEEVLDLLSLTKKIHFKIEGRRVTVMP